MLARAQHYTDQGLGAIKMQAGHIRPWREDVANLKAMREFVGDDVEIMIDVNMGWSADIAIQAGRHFDDYDLYWLEEPVVCEDFEGYQRIASHLKTRVVGGESHGADEIDVIDDHRQFGDPRPVSRASRFHRHT